MEIRQIEISEVAFRAFRESEEGLIKNNEYFRFATGQLGTVTELGESVLLVVRDRTKPERKETQVRRLSKNQQKARRRRMSGK